MGLHSISYFNAESESSNMLLGKLPMPFSLLHHETVKMTADTLSRGRILQMASQCVVFCQAQASQGKAFKFPLKIDSSFSFDPKLIIPVLTGEQLFKYWRKNICITYLPKMWYLLAKTCSWCQWNLKFGTQTNYLMPRKKPQNNFFTGASIIVKMEFEIFKYFFIV